MASEVGSAGVNGVHHASNGTSIHSQSSSGTTDIPKEEVAWYFVEQYYTTLSRSPDKLYLFFNKRSQYVSGVEDEKVSVCIGQKAINERIKDLDFNETKVRVTNVDSQASDSNIVIQVIGEMSNKSQPHKKFVQTFVLAGQTNGYFVLNDIFRYIKDDDDEDVAESTQATEMPSSGFVEPTHTSNEEVADESSKKATVTDDQAVAQVDNKLEDVIKQDPESAKDTVSSAGVNGTPAEEETKAAAADVASASGEEASQTETTEPPAAETAVEPEKPKDPAPTPAPAAKGRAATLSNAPTKPAVPKTWAQLASGNRASLAAAASNTTAPPATQTKASAPAPAPSQPAAAPATPAAPAAAAAIAREPSPDSQKSGSQGGWQSVGTDHARKGSRAQPALVPNDNGHVRAYVKHVGPGITNEELKTHLSQFGELVYFDVNRQKNAAFAEFTSRATFEAAVAANPHKIKGESLFVEERRMPPNQFGRGGGSLRGRGGFDGRPQGGRGGFKPDGQPGAGGRGGYGPRGRGNAAARGRGGPPPAAA